MEIAHQGNQQLGVILGGFRHGMVAIEGDVIGAVRMSGRSLAGMLKARHHRIEVAALDGTAVVAAAADAEWPTAPGDPDPPVTAAGETADAPAEALEKDLAALVATRGLLASRRIGRGWEISGREEQRPPTGDWAT